MTLEERVVQELLSDAAKFQNEGFAAPVQEAEIDAIPILLQNKPPQLDMGTVGNKLPS